jgi:hypothetical protein
MNLKEAMEKLGVSKVRIVSEESTVIEYKNGRAHRATPDEKKLWDLFGKDGDK